MTPTSVLLVTPRWTRDGGVATHVVSSAGALARQGVQVHVLAARLELEEQIEGVTLHRSADLFDASAAPQARVGAAGGLTPDVVHAHQFEDPDVLAHLRALAPVVISVHGYSACAAGVHYFRPGQECTRAHGPGCIPNLLLRGCAHTRNPASLPASYARAARSLRALRVAELAISYASVVDQHLRASGVSERARVPLFPTIAAERTPPPRGRRRVLFAGRVVAPKGVDVLIRAARETDAEFVICGDGRQLQSMRELTARAGVAERVRFAGWLSAELLARELSEANVLAMPSRWPEPAGLVGLEAYAAGRPVVASATGGVRDWLSDGENGLLVRPGQPRELAQALTRLLDDPESQGRMGATGARVVAERYTPELHVRALLEAYARARQLWLSRRAGEAAPRELEDAPRPLGARS